MARTKKEVEKINEESTIITQEENKQENNDNGTANNALTITRLATAQKILETKLKILNALDKTEENYIELYISANEAVNEAVKDLNAEEKAAEYNEILSTENPALEACKRGIINYTVIKQPNKKNPEYHTGKKFFIIDLKELQDFSSEDSGIWANKKAMFLFEALNHLVLDYEVRQGDGVKSNKWKNWQLSEFAANILGVKIDDIQSADDFLPVVQKCADALTDGIKLNVKDVAYFIGKYAAWSKNINGVKVTKEAQFRQQLMRLFNKTVTGEKWIIE